MLEGVPDGIYLDAVERTLKGISGVSAIHDLHIWALTTNAPSLSVHLVIADAADADNIRMSASDKLAAAFDIDHVTIQTERLDCRVGRDHHGLH